MSNVISLDEMRPHRTGVVECARCNYKWVGVWLADAKYLHCPECDGTINEYGTAVSAHTCKLCHRRYTVCPEVSIDDPYWENCLSEDCTSYDASRDVDRFFDEIRRDDE